MAADCPSVGVTYRIDAAVLAVAKNPDAFPALPAVHDNSTSVGAAVLAETGLMGAEVSDELFHSSASLVFQQAENRMHAIKALLVADLAGGSPGWVNGRDPR
jgi:ornithine carbamoyltransferase